MGHLSYRAIFAVPTESGALPTELSRRSWPPGSRTQRLPLYQSGPFTGWVAASGSGASRTLKAEARPGSSRVQSPVCLRFHARRGRESNSQGRSSAAFGAVAVTYLLASPWRKVHGSNVCGRTRPPVSSGGTLPLGQPPVRGERATRTPRRSAHSLAARPGTLARSLSIVPTPGFEPGTSWVWARRLCQLV